MYIGNGKCGCLSGEGRMSFGLPWWGFCWANGFKWGGSPAYGIKPRGINILGGSSFGVAATAALNGSRGDDLSLMFFGFDKFKGASGSSGVDDFGEGGILLPTFAEIWANWAVAETQFGSVHGGIKELSNFPFAFWVKCMERPAFGRRNCSKRGRYISCWGLGSPMSLAVAYWFVRCDWNSWILFWDGILLSCCFFTCSCWIFSNSFFGLSAETCCPVNA